MGIIRPYPHPTPGVAQQLTLTQLYTAAGATAEPEVLRMPHVTRLAWNKKHKLIALV